MALFFFLTGFPFNQEVLYYNIYLGHFPIGELRLTAELAPDSLQDLDSVYYFSATLKSNFPFKINDSLFSITRMKDWATLKSYKRVQEGRYQKEIEFQFKEGRIEYTDGKVFPCVSPPKDLLTLWYYFRSSSEEKETALHIDKKNYQVKIISRKASMISTPLGSFLSRHLVPKTFPRTLLGDVYISEDSLRLPLIIKTNLLLGMVKAVIKAREVR